MRLIFLIIICFSLTGCQTIGAVVGGVASGAIQTTSAVVKTTAAVGKTAANYAINNFWMFL